MNRADLTGAIPTALPDVIEFVPRVIEDERGSFFEAFRQSWLVSCGKTQQFVQQNQSRSRHGVLRGLHYQMRHPQGKLVRVLSGCILDVALDIRPSSAFFGRHVSVMLDSERQNSLWVPAGFAHGFLVLSECAEVLYQCTDYYDPADQYAIHWQDPQLNIQWPLPASEIILSDKDNSAPSWSQVKSDQRLCF